MANATHLPVASSSSSAAVVSPEAVRVQAQLKEAEYALARRMMEEENYEKAIVHLERLLRDPGHLQGKQTDMAVALAEALMKTDPLGAKATTLRRELLIVHRRRADMLWRKLAGSCGLTSAIKPWHISLMFGRP
jgi:hypothetical protein